MNEERTEKHPVRAGVFSTLPSADRAVAHLLAASFTAEEISVVCSNETKEAHFREFEHQEPAGSKAGTGAVAGAGVGAALGGLTALAVGAATGVVPLIIAGGAGVALGTGAGTFLGPMLTRGGEKELANYYDQAVMGGKLVVAVEIHGPDAAERLARAEQIIADAGAEPVALDEG
jgi:hypothetical protein